MAITSVPEATWTEITTTTEDTSFQNRGGSVMYLTTVATGALDLNDGIAVPPEFAVVVAAGKTVSVSFPQGSGFVHYVGV
jgi:hypothetical protein